MAVVTIPAENRRLEDPAEIASFLAPYGIWHERWDVEGRIGPSASNEEILAAYAPEVERLKQRGGYVTADVINVTPDTPGLEGLINKFNKEHTHAEDEVRFIVKGRGIFHINPVSAPVFAIQTEAGDLINVPAGTRHWFDFCEERTIRAIRLFLDPAGWAPSYLDDGQHSHYEPVCWGPAYVAGETVRNTAVRL